MSGAETRALTVLNGERATTRLASPPHPPLGGIIVKTPLTQGEYEALKGAMPTPRDRLLLKYLRATGFRISECLKLTPSLLGGAHDYCVLVRRGKRRVKGKRVDGWERWPIAPEVAQEIQDHIHYHRVGLTDPVFAVSSRQVRRVFAAAGQRALGRDVNPHQVRGLYVTSLVDAGIPLAVAARMVGHSDERTTLKHYVANEWDRIVAIQRRVRV